MRFVQPIKAFHPATHGGTSRDKIHAMTPTTVSETVFVVTAPSAVSYRQCLLGQGATKAEALTDAFGPKPWPKSAKNADCYSVTLDELDALRAGVNS
jgi:hypothetical protein